MTSFAFKRRLLASACILSVSAASALAQEQLAEVDEVLVTGKPIRDSQAAALARKQEADNVVDIIAADTIGRFPDQNLADSLGRIPGLAIERDQGQARFINFRGAPFRYTAIAFDGVDVPGAENGRIPRFDSFPSTVTSAIEINKAVTPDMPGEAVAGFVDISTFKPFDQDGLRVSLEGGYGQQGLGSQGIEKYNGLISYSEDRWGILGFYSYNKRGRITSNREFELSVDTASNEIIPDNLDFRSYRGERTDESYGGALEFKPNETTLVYVRSLFAEFVDLEERNQFDFDITDGANITGTPLQPTTGYQPLVLVTRLLEDGKYNNSTWTNTAGVDFMVEDWDISAKVNYTETQNDTELPIPLSAGATIAASYDISDIDQPIVNVFAPFTMTPTDINTLDYAANLALNFNSTFDIEAIKFKVDAARELELFDRQTEFKTGLQLDFRDAEGQGTGVQIGPIPSGVNINDFVTDDLWDTVFNNSIGGRNVDNQGLQDAFDAAGGIQATFDPLEATSIEENIYSGYLMGTTEFDWGNIVYGARVEFTDFTSTGFTFSGGVETPISVSDNSVDILPSVHINWDVSDEVKLRLSGTSGVSRPTYTEARANVGVDVVNQELDGGNPRLEAETAYGADVSLEWYYAEASLFSVGAYYRAIDNVIYADTTTITNAGAISNGLIPDGTPTTYNSFFNGKDGELLGFEVNFIGQATFLPYPFDGFGVAGNITIIDSEFTATTRGNPQIDSLPGTSDLIYNASIFFENFGISARLNYQWRDDWLSTTENDSLSEFWAATERLDFSFRYDLPFSPDDRTKFTLFADANNLTNFFDVRFADERRTPNQVEGFGRRFLIGLRVDY